ncbi:hypothetical protein NL676_001951 [Syzygium grande]|nr:hypothetical protein NL676_001951 [Syzygium grande]
MSGVWVFENGVYRLVKNPQAEGLDGEAGEFQGDADLIQFHKHNSNDLISLPCDFSKFSTVHMDNIVINNPNIFHIQEHS